MNTQVNGGHHDTLRAHPGHVGGEFRPGVLPGHVDQFGVAVHLGRSGRPGGRAGGLPVIVPGPTEIPTATPAGTQPARMSLAKSWPDRSELNGRGGAGAPWPRTAVPIACNSRPPNANSPKVSKTPTTPCPPSAAHWAVIRPIAFCLTSYMAWTIGRTANPPWPDTRVSEPAGPESLLDQPPAQPAAPT